MELNHTQFPVVYKKQRKISRHRSVQAPNRLIDKRGALHIRMKNLPEKSRRYALDLWHTLASMRWRWLLLTVSVVNAAAYLVFSAVFLLDAWISGDFEQADRRQMCIQGVHNFTSFLMLGIETITSTGYGYLYPTERCHFAVAALIFSTMVAILIDGAFISVVYAKITQPRTHKIAFSLFSKKAVICLRNGKLCLIFRVNDRLGKHWINRNVRLFLLREQRSEEEELIPSYIEELGLQPFGTLFLPVDIVHEIDAASPLWGVSASDLMMARFELVATITGDSVLTGQASTSQTSYLNSEILWGCRFGPCVILDECQNEYVVDKRNFNRTILMDTPLCSAKHLKKVESEIVRKYSSSSERLWKPEE